MVWYVTIDLSFVTILMYKYNMKVQIALERMLLYWLYRQVSVYVKPKKVIREFIINTIIEIFSKKPIFTIFVPLNTK